MTFKEKLAMEHPDKLDPTEAGGCIDCPVDYGYESEDECTRACRTNTCKQCWDREIPTTEKNNEKENKNMATTRKTKEELFNELKEARNKIYDLEKELKAAKEREKLQECADQVVQLRDAFINAGFTREEAMSLVRTAIEATLGR